MKSPISKPSIALLVSPGCGFGGAGGSERRNDVTKIESSLKSFGYKVSIACASDVLSMSFDSETIIVYTSFDEPAVRRYITDVVRILSHEYRIVPSYDSLLAHENKGFQELVRARLVFGNVKGIYVYDYDQLPLNYPYVFKTISGAGSKNVYLIRSKRDRACLKRFFRVSIWRRLLLLLRKYQYSSVAFQHYKERHKGFCLGVVQDYIPNLKEDYKILVFGSRYYVLTRKVRPNDFRASGSGLLSFDPACDELLSYAEGVFRTLGEPFVSLDVANSGKEMHLIEYQVLNFGPYALVNSPGYYERCALNGDWQFFEGKACIESEFARAIHQHIASRF